MILIRGAEAVLSKSEIIGIPAVLKKRIGKRYRVRRLDEKLRRERTRGEARLLNKAKLAGVDCPTVLQVNDFEIYITFLEGERPGMSKEECSDAGKMLAKLHENDIIHGDYTPANLILTPEGMFVIDFGLGFISKDIEDKAVDVFTMLRAIENRDAFLEGYRSYKKADSILRRVKKVEQRVRYAF